MMADPTRIYAWGVTKNALQEMHRFYFSEDRKFAPRMTSPEVGGSGSDDDDDDDDDDDRDPAMLCNKCAFGHSAKRCWKDGCNSNGRYKIFLCDRCASGHDKDKVLLISN